MTTEDSFGSNLERCVSYGRGGAGNLRASIALSAVILEVTVLTGGNPTTGRPSEVREGNSAVDPDELQRRRSSVWSTTSSHGEGKKGSIVKSVTSMFRKGSTGSVEELVTEKQEE